MAHSGGDEDDPSTPEFWSRAFEEAATPFEPAPDDTPTLETYRRLYQTVLRHSDFTCAMTGTAYPPSDSPHENLQVTPIRPLAAGGLLHVGNFLCLCNEADKVFVAGIVTVGTAYELIADLSRIAPEFQQRLNPDGRLRLPRSRAAIPDQEALAFHRSRIFQALI